MDFGLLHIGDDGEHSGVGFVEMSKAIASQKTLFVGTEPLDWSLAKWAHLRCRREPAVASLVPSTPVKVCQMLSWQIKKSTSFHQYLTYSHKRGTIPFSTPSGII